jgi:hypothetical protein
LWILPGRDENKLAAVGVTDIHKDGNAFLLFSILQSRSFANSLLSGERLPLFDKLLLRE